MQNFFQELLQELGESLHLPLHQDHLGACTLLVDKRLVIQLKPDFRKNHLLIACFISPLPPGKFRENIFCEALKANDLPNRIGIFAFNEKNHELVLFDYLFFLSLNTPMLKSFLTQFIEKALLWKNSIEKENRAPTISSPTTEHPHPFGLKP